MKEIKKIHELIDSNIELEICHINIKKIILLLDIGKIGKKEALNLAKIELEKLGSSNKQDIKNGLKNDLFGKFDKLEDETINNASNFLSDI